MDAASNDACASCAGAHPTHLADGIGRRAFIAQSALLAAGALLAAACGGDLATAPTTISPTTPRVADYSALASVGGIALVSISGSPFAIVRTSDTSFVALSRICPHQGNIVSQSGSGFLCPGHGARFSANGTWVGGQPTSSLRSYATSYDATAGTITIG
jgi:nitrite reductase/ring-hydroxylating ferredoxin subunit